MKLFGKEFGTAAVAEAPEVNLAEQLSAAQKAISELEQRQNILAIRIADTSDQVDRLGRNSFGSDDLSRSRRSRQMDKRQELAALEAEQKTVVRDVAVKRADVETLLAQVNSHPTYCAAISEHKALVKRAVELGEKSWRAPIGEIASIERQIEDLAREESQFVSEANSRLRGAGLPEIKPRLRGVAFVPPVTDFNFVALERDAAEGMRRASDF